MFDFTYARPHFGFAPEEVSPPSASAWRHRIDRVWQVRRVTAEPAAPSANRSSLQSTVPAEAPAAVDIPVVEAEPAPPPEDVAIAGAECLASPDEPPADPDAAQAVPPDVTGDGLDGSAAQTSGPIPAPQPEPEPVAEAEPKPVAEAEPEPEPEPVPAAEPAPELEPDPRSSADEAEICEPARDEPAPAAHYPVPALRADALRDPVDLRFPLEMRALERRLDVLWQEIACPVVAVLGASPRAGATTVSMALARHLSGRGKRVLLCGDTARLREAIVAPRPRSLPIDIITLPYLTAVNLADLFRPLEDDGAPLKLERWLASLKPRFDVMLLDLAPPTRAPDSVSLLTMVDGVALVVRAGHSRTAEVDAAVDAILEAGATPLGFVFNGRAREPRKFGRRKAA